MSLSGGGDAVARLALALQVQGDGFRVLVAHKPCVSLNSRVESGKEKKNKVGRTLNQSQNLNPEPYSVNPKPKPRNPEPGVLPPQVPQPQVVSNSKSGD